MLSVYTDYRFMLMSTGTTVVARIGGAFHSLEQRLPGNPQNDTPYRGPICDEQNPRRPLRMELVEGPSDKAPATMQYNSVGIAYVSLQWIFTAIALLAVTLRLYSRTLLTRSVGSDDFLIAIAFVLNVAVTISDFKAFENGWSQHESHLPSEMYAIEQKWEFIGYIQAYIAFFFIRASIGLFVLRLLPSYKKWQQRVVCVVLLVNFAVTAYTCIMFGVSCIPFKANWEDVPNAKCFSKDLLATTNQINAALACACDIAIALVPQFLLWGVQMKKRTKRQLNIIFGLGLVTALLSIGRAATLTKQALTEDTTWNMVPSYYLTMFEDKLGIIFACAPALRQFWAYRTRTNTFLPSKQQQYPNQDFEKMRSRINLRDIFWYRKAHPVGDRVFEATPIFRSKSPPPSSDDPERPKKINSSILDIWENKIKHALSSSHDQKSTSWSPSEGSKPISSKISTEKRFPNPPNPDNRAVRKPPSARRWGTFSRRPESPGGSSRETFLLSDSGAGTSAAMTTRDNQDDDASNEMKATSGSQMYKRLKKLIKLAAETADTAGKSSYPQFFYSLDRNLEDVDTFYNKKYSDAARRLKLLQDRYGRATESPNTLDKDELEDLMGALLELRGQLRKLQWYGEVNRRGFIKITKKLDKKVGHLSTQRRYLETKVDPKDFATNLALSETVSSINDWLSLLGDIKIPDDASSTHSAHSIQRVSSKAVPDLPASLLESIDQALRTDNAEKLLKIIGEANLGPEDSPKTLSPVLAQNLLQRAIAYRSKNCIDKVLDHVETMEDEDDINRRNCIHRLVVSMGRSMSGEEHDGEADSPRYLAIDQSQFITPAAPPMLGPPLSFHKELDGITRLSRDDKSVIILRYLLEKLRLHQRNALQATDSYGRMPLHYAAQYGFVVICQIIISHMQTWGLFEIRDGVDAPFWPDADGLAPLQLSVIGGHYLTARVLLESEDWRGINDRKAAVQKHMSRSGEILALATKSNFVAIVQLLAEAGVDLDYQDDQGETALHLAARFGHVECAGMLLKGCDTRQANIELAENVFGWTPLFIASVEGHFSIVELLVDAKADVDKADSSGWTAQEHAALRGHIEIAEKLATSALTTEKWESKNSPTVPSSFAGFTGGNLEKKAKRMANGTGNTAVSVTEPVKTFGHRYLTKESMILVSLGSMDMRKSVQAVSLDRIPLKSAHTTQLDTALSIVVSATGADGEPSIIDLPVQDNISTEPIVFTATEATKVKLLFDIVHTYAGNSNQVVGRGVAILSSIKPSIGTQRITLQGDVAVPIVAASTLDVIGSVNFNFLIIKPFSHPKMTITENQTYWKSMSSTMVIGHRGLGKNVAARRSLQLGENTIQSFIAAANLGASYVEFDVQLTKDHVPVIYHDFLVSETGIDAPVHTLTLEQFLHINDTRTPRVSRPTSPVAKHRDLQEIKTTDTRRHRSMSLGYTTREGDTDMSERMKHTRDFKEKGFKGNSRGNFIQAPFTTLEEMFKKLPQHVGFNIEMKYPMLHESEEQEMDTYAVELNSFVDTVLTKVYDLGHDRPIIFSSFNPDICLLLSFKQPSIPVLFLTDAGTCPVGDIRASSLQEAVRFASRWNLLGIVAAAEPLVLCPRLVKVVKESGLVCVSYGTANNDGEKVKLQVDEGIDAVIVDSVLAIRKGLTGRDRERDGVANGAVNGVAIGVADGVKVA
ncbi:MAG: hypothetical protein Q9215_002639 [Flavoplaca cf. flavocitrina]